jgi:hypothetical protein
MSRPDETPENALADYEAELGDAQPVTGLSILEGMADAMPQSESRRAFREALEQTRENARRLLKGSPAGLAIFGDPIDDESDGA